MPPKRELNFERRPDEMDEGTAIFKCTNDVPVGKSRFVNYDDLPSDFYLWLRWLRQTCSR